MVPSEPDAVLPAVRADLPSAAEIDPLVRGYLAHQIWAQIRFCSLPLIAAILLSVAEIRSLGGGPAIWWWGAAALLDVVRGQVMNRINGRRIVAGLDDPTYRRRNIPQYVIFGLIWGALPLAVGATNSNDTATWFANVVVLGVITVLVVTVAADRVFFGVTLVAISFPVAVGCLTGALPAGIFAVVTFTYYGIVLYVHSTLHKAVVEAARSTFESRMLADSLARVLALQDPLTRLLNRAGLGEWVTREAQSRHGSLRIGVAIGNVERLSVINDIFGSGHGDSILSALSTRLTSAVGSDVAVARVGGDEFAVVGILGAGSDELELRDHLLRAVLDPFEVDGQLLDLGLSTAALTGEHTELEALLAVASSQVRDQRRLRAQSLTVVEGQLEGRRTLLDDLRLGMASGQILPWFQPIIDFPGMAVHGFEALVRWEHPTRGPLAPHAFLGLVAVAGLTATMTELMLLGSARFARDLRAAGLGHLAVVHVNLTPLDVARADIPDLVRRLLREHELPATALVIEITEQDVPRLDAPLMDNLALLERMGVEIAIDDFGTGYSSFSHLLDIKAHQLKIDKRFVDGLPHDPASVAVVKAILGLAGGLGMRTVAEGVELPEQSTFLSAHGCDSFQGYLVAPALRPGDALAFVVGHEPAVLTGPALLT